MTDRKITAIYGETRSEEEIVHVVGGVSVVTRGLRKSDRFEAVKIERREENLGTYGIVWFDVHSADRVELSVNAFSVAEVHYAAEDAA